MSERKKIIKQVLRDFFPEQDVVFVDEPDLELLTEAINDALEKKEE